MKLHIGTSYNSSAMLLREINLNEWYIAPRDMN